MLLKFYFALLALMLCTHAAFAQASAAVQNKALLNEQGDKLLLNGKVLLDAQKEKLFSLHKISYAPDDKHFLLIVCGYECNDNLGFLFNADGGGRRLITARWDYILRSIVEWSADGRTLFYYRINSSGADVPRRAPSPGWVQIDVRTGRKAPAVARRLKQNVSYAVFNVAPQDKLNVRAAPQIKAAVTGALPHDAQGVVVTGAGVKRGAQTWAPIRYQNIVGWVNQSYLHEAPR